MKNIYSINILAHQTSSKHQKHVKDTLIKKKNFLCVLRVFCTNLLK